MEHNDSFSDHERSAIAFLMQNYMRAAIGQSVLETQPIIPGQLSVTIRHEYEAELLPRLEQLGASFTLTRRIARPPESSWSDFQLHREGLADALQGMYSSLNDERRDVFEDLLLHSTLNNVAQIRNPLDGRWLNVDLAARYFSERISETEKQLAGLKEQLRGDVNAQDLTFKVAALRKTGREKE